MSRKLVRSRDDKMLCGVAAGIARYLDIDPTIVRVLWVLAIVIPGSNIIVVVVYLLLCLLMPLEVPGSAS
jgi:phage shock protein PspC (stress-responsive transcriptional regulator)